MSYGLIGKSLSHSYSKIIHEMLGKYEYQLLPMGESDVASFIANREFKGLNVTIPYKKTVMPLCDFLSEKAKVIGAVNTLYFDGEGSLCGTNTDYDGFLYMAKRAGISFKEKTVLILGDGGASLAVQKAVLDGGAREMFIASRKAGAPHTISYDTLSLCAHAEVIVNTTPVGMYPANGQYLIDLSGFPKCTGVLDLIYNPFMTELLFQAKSRGIPYANGLSMLVAQATNAAGLFLGGRREILGEESAFQKENERILSTLEADLSNIVLIGMPGCGKTTIGRELAKRLSRDFVDLDEAVARESALSIPEIFEKHGETAFRDMESAFARDCGKKRSQVIATGGGIVLKKENMLNLAQNGKVVFIDRPLSSLAMEGRPLSRDENALKKMAKDRLPLYNKYSDFTIECGGDVSENVDAIISALNLHP